MDEWTYGTSLDFGHARVPALWLGGGGVVSTLSSLRLWHIASSRLRSVRLCLREVVGAVEEINR